MFTGLFNISFTLQLIALFAAFILLNRRTGAWRIIPVFLLLGIMAETTGWYVAWKLRMPNNIWIFNINICITAVSTLWVLSTVTTQQNYRKTIYMLCGLFILLTSGSFLTGTGPVSYNSKIEILSDISLAAVSCLLLYGMLGEQEYRNLFTYEYFWLANAVLVCSLGKAVLAVSMPEFYQYQLETKITLWQYLNDTLNLLLYSSYIIAFICRNRNTRQLHSWSL